MSIQKKDKKSEKELLDEIYNIIGELSNIEINYCSWDELSKSEVVFKAREMLLEGFVKEFNEKQ